MMTFLIVCFVIWIAVMGVSLIVCLVNFHRLVGKAPPTWPGPM